MCFCLEIPSCAGRRLGRRHSERNEDACLYTIFKILVFIDTLSLVVHGFIGVLYGGFWIAQNFTLSALFQVSNHNKSSMELALMNRILDDLYVEPIDHIVIGALEIYLALLICCATSCELKTMLRVMCWVCGVFVLHDIVTFIYALKILEDLESGKDVMERVLWENFINLFTLANGTDRASRFTFEMNGMQVIYSCCGVRGYGDFGKTKQWRASVGSDLVVPATCCVVDKDAYLFFNCLVYEQDNCVTNPTTKNSHMHQGCVEPILHNMKQRISVLSLIWDALSGFLFAFTFSLFICQIRESRKPQEDPFAALRDGRFLEETELFVKQMAVQNGRTGDQTPPNELVLEDKEASLEDTEDSLSHSLLGIFLGYSGNTPVDVNPPPDHADHGGEHDPVTVKNAEAE